MTILRSLEWGGDLELLLLAIGIQQDIVVITLDNHNNCYTRRFSCQPPCTFAKDKGRDFYSFN